MSQLTSVKDFFKAYRRSLKQNIIQMDKEAKNTEGIYDTKLFYVVQNASKSSTSGGTSGDASAANSGKLLSHQ